MSVLAGPVHASMVHAPLAFEENRGQAPPEARYLARGAGYTVLLTAREALLLLRPLPHAGSASGALGLRLEGAATARLEAAEELPGKSNYLIGRDPAKWRTGVPNFAKVAYRDVYPGIDLVYYGRPGQLESDLVVRPGADPARIRLAFDGAESVELAANDDLIVHLPGGDLRLEKPTVYQGAAGARREIASRYVIDRRGRVGVRTAAYDRDRPLVIDPVLGFSTYLGGSADDAAHGVAVDSAGNAYVTGATSSTNFPTVNAHQNTPAGDSDVFVAKFDPAGSLVYSTYLGGKGDDYGYAIAVDASGNAYITGVTSSSNPPDTNFPITRCLPKVLTPGIILPPCSPPFQSDPGGLEDAFVAKLDARGVLVYSTFLGGSQNDVGLSVAVDAAGNAHVAGWTDSTDFPLKNPSQPVFGGGFDPGDAFVAKLNADGSDLVYSTFLGGAGRDEATGIAVRSFFLPGPPGTPCCPIISFAYVTGWIESDDGSAPIPAFPTTPGAFQTSFHPGAQGFSTWDAFVTELSPTGSLVYSTLLGGSGSDKGSAIAVDAAGNTYVTGETTSTDFPSSHPFQAGSGLVAPDAFVTKLNASGSSLVYSTFLGGNGADIGNGIAVDATGDAYVTGETTSTDFPTARALQATLGGGGPAGDAFVAKLSSDGTLSYATYLGGTSRDAGKAVAVDANGNAYVTGETTSTDFPTARPIQATLGGAGDAFVAKISDVAPGQANLTVTEAASPDPVVAGAALTYGVTVTNSGPGNAGQVTLVEDLSPSVTFLATASSRGECSRTAVGKTVICHLGSLLVGESASVKIAVQTNGAP